MKKKLIVNTIFLLLLLICLSNTAAAEGENNDTEEIKEGFYSVLDDYAVFYGDIFEKGFDEIKDGNSFLNLLPELKMTDILKGLSRGKIEAEPKQICGYIARAFAKEVYSAAKLMAVVLALSVLSSYISALKSGFGESSISQAAFYVCYTVTAGVAATVFYETSLCAAETVENIALFMKLIVPAVITLLMTSGAAVSASVLEPTILSIVEIAVPTVRYVFIPAVMISTALNIVNGVSDRFKTDRMVKLFNSSVKWGLSVMLTVFVSLAGLKSIASAGADGLTVKLSKFATSNLVPMIGGILSESVETVMNCSVVIKNSVGVLGIICLILIALGPVLKLGAILVLFRLTAAAAEPVSEPKIIVCISRLADSVAVLFSVTVAVTVMFIIVVTVLINAGNSAVLYGRYGVTV